MEMPLNQNQIQNQESAYTTQNSLILKNESTANGDLYIEGTQKSIKNLLKQNLIVKPLCMFD